jgi:hypothetical protein
LRAFKSWGRLLDEAGHAAGVVAVDPWAATRPPQTRGGQ